MHIPSSTYRIQLHKDFTLRDLQRILKYLHALGISTVYASPLMKATPDSMHGYDVVDPHAINPELGNGDTLRSIAKELRKLGMTWLQDIVPNHMAFHPMNWRLMDVLERGPESPYYRYFDIDWEHPDPELRGKVMVPFLGDEWTACAERREVSVVLSETGLALNYFQNAYPLSLPAYRYLIQRIRANNSETPLDTILTKMIAAAEGRVNYDTWQTMKTEFLQSIHAEEEHVRALGEVVDHINSDPKLLDAIAETLYYRLCFWKETERRINYRRFFTVNELICLRMEDEEVFEEYHQTLSKFYSEKLVQGFRIDHIDGLQDPAKYTRDLRDVTGDDCYIIAEKILEAKEDMPAQWPIQGTSGYEFLSLTNQLLTHRKGAKELLTYYQQLLPHLPAYGTLIFDSKKLILENYMAGEWENVTRLFFSLGLGEGYDRESIKRALGYFMLSLPVYRIYPSSLPLKGKTLLIIHEAFEKAMIEGVEYADELDYLLELFTGTPGNQEQHDRVLHFLKRLMQFTGPLTAKGVEDTTFYIYNPLISHDEVGDSPAPLGMSVTSFHEKMLLRQASTPLSLNATATHDTKRGEDARVRINVLSRVPSSWKEQVERWFEINGCCRTTLNNRTVPELNDEYFIYQSMLGGFPDDFRVTEEWVRRVQSYLNKALREAKVNTNWTEPDEAYEKACEQFIEQILQPEHTFLASFIPFVRTICEHAMVYTLSQTLIKLTAPGIPDIYQGCELWDLSFVDPDNRRPVDFDTRMEFLFQLVVKEEKGKDALFEYLREHREAGIEKLYLIWKTLNYRRSNPLLFSEGNYLPLSITGSETTAVAYARSHGTSWILVVMPLGLVKHDLEEVEDALAGQYLVLPEEAPAHWTNLFTGQEFDVPNHITLIELFSRFPVALLTGAQGSSLSTTA